MGFFSDDSQQRQQRDEFVNGDFQEHHASKVHELLAGGAAFEAMHAYEQHEQREGKPENHGLAKEIIAGLVGVETLTHTLVDRLAENKGLNWLDREKAKRGARQQAEYAYDQQYQQQY